MTRGHPPASGRDRPEAEFRAAADRKYRDRPQIVLTSDRGRRPVGTAADLGISTRAAPRRPDAHLDRGLDGLRPRTATGAAPEAPARPAEEAQRRVISGPAAWGLGRANRTGAEPADPPFEPRGIAAGRPAVLRPCERPGVRACRPTYRFLPADPCR